MTGMLRNISQTFSSLRLRQVLFWIVVWGAFVYFDESDYPFRLTLLLQLGNTLLLALLINFNMQILIPEYLNERKYIRYILYVILTAIVITPIKLTISYLLKKHYNIPVHGVFNNGFIHVLSYVILAFGASFFQILTDWAVLLQEKKKLRIKTAQAELQALKNQLNPHFLFNTLNNLYALTLKKSDHAPEMVLKLSEMMRYMLYEGNAGLVPLENEIQYLRNYLDLERIKQTEGFDITMEVEGNPSPYKIPPMIFLPFIENSIKHGLNRSIDQGFIHIRITIKDNQLYFHISNSTAETTSPQRSGGIGIPNVKNRLAMLYPHAHQLEMHASERQYQVSLQIDLSKHSKILKS